MKLLKKVALQYITPLLSLCSLIAAPMFADDCCDMDLDCDPCDPGWCTLWIPALVGTVGGAITGAAIHHKSKRGKRGGQGIAGHTGARGSTGDEGSVGEAGPAPFRHDTDNDLSFSYTLTDISFTTTGTPTGVSIKPYFSTPEGRVFTAGGFTLATLVPVSKLSEVIANPAPAFGQYGVGLSIDAFSPLATLSFDWEFVISSLDDRPPTQYQGTFAPTTGTITEEQIEVTYTFGTNGTVPQS